ncbi:hypothetical protein HHK36_013018 [Tetracentron sinense]|uniref:Uncharacterized protein n=1 Tax=Tetracentron sinense TaxID=13715 RepID=A0A834ZDX4_TETSI|nr:hypothetical protein HHK36_013018 [Tetracentron sinense]
MRGISASSPPTIYPSPLKTKSSRYCSPSTFVVPCLCSQHPCYSSNLKLRSTRHEGGFSGLRVQCSRSGGTGSGENDSRSVLDAFFLGKALAEALNERIESTVGELLSAVGRLQAEQQKQVQDFQEEVLERAKQAKEKAAREALEAPGLIPNSTTIESSASTDFVTTEDSPPAANDVPPVISPSLSDPTTTTNSDPTDKDPLPGTSSDD